MLTDADYLRDKLRTVVSLGRSWCGVNRMNVRHHRAAPGYPCRGVAVLPPLSASGWSDDPSYRDLVQSRRQRAGGGRRDAGNDLRDMHLGPDPAGCVVGAQLTAEVLLPLFSGKAERVINDKVAELMMAEYQFTLDWLHVSAAS